MDKNKIIEKIKKVRELANRGVDGEKETAEKILEQLLKQYNINEKDIEEEKKNFYGFRIGDDVYFQKLFFQIWAKQFGKASTLRSLNRKNHKILFDKYIDYCKHEPNSDILIECTMSEFLQMQAIFPIYKRDFIENRDLFYLAYLSKNDLLVESKNPFKEYTEEELERWRKAYALTSGIDKLNINPLLNEHKNE